MIEGAYDRGVHDQRGPFMSGDIQDEVSTSVCFEALCPDEYNCVIEPYYVSFFFSYVLEGLGLNLIIVLTRKAQTAVKSWLGVPLALFSPNAVRCHAIPVLAFCVLSWLYIVIALVANWPFQPGFSAFIIL